MSLIDRAFTGTIPSTAPTSSFLPILNRMAEDLKSDITAIISCIELLDSITIQHTSDISSVSSDVTSINSQLLVLQQEVARLLSIYRDIVPLDFSAFLARIPTPSQYAAIAGSNAPSATNVFITESDLNNEFLVYDSDNNGIVDNSENLNGQPSSYYLNRANHTGTQVSNTISDKGLANGIASLDGSGKIITSQLPALAISNTFVVATQSAMLLLTAETGDVAVRTDQNKSYILAGSNPTILADWQELLTPASSVLSVNGQTGVVSLTTTNIPEGTNKYFTDERAQDAIGAALTDTTTIDFTYNDAGNQITADLKNTTITPGSYGSGSQVGSFAVDAQGRLTAATNTAISVTSSGITDFTEAAQDAVGAALTDTSSVDFTYNDAGNAISAVVLPAGVDHNSLANFVANKHIDHSGVSINPGTGLSGGGDITATRTLTLANTAVTPGSYGSGTQVGTFTVDAQGRITAAANTAISFPGSSGTQEVFSTSNTSTSSFSYVLMNTMTITPVSGTYAVFFSASGSNSLASAIANYAIFSDGSQITQTERSFDLGGGDVGTIQTQGLTTVNGSQAIEIRYKTSAGTITIEERNLLIIRIS